MGKKNKGGQKGDSGNKQHATNGVAGADQIGENTAYQKQQLGQQASNKKK